MIIQQLRSGQNFGHLHAPTSFPRDAPLNDSGAASLARASRGIAGGPVVPLGGGGGCRLGKTIFGVPVR
jgi:hypothetical protein